MAPARDHDSCRILVCGLCVNSHGDKAARKVNKEEEEIIQTFVPGYSSLSPYFPSGICVSCIFLLNKKKNGAEVKIILPQEYHVSLPRNLRSNQMEKCPCKFCHLARLSGPAYLHWQRKTKGREKPKVSRLCTRCYQGVLHGQSHSCSVSTLEAVENLTLSLPEEIRAKLAHSYLVNQATENEPVFLPPAAGGHVLPVVCGRQPVGAGLVPLNHSEVLTIGAQNHLSSQQTENIMADLRTKYGRSFVAPGIAKASTEHNRKYDEFFTSEEVILTDSKGNEFHKTFFYCSSLLPFIQSVCSTRGIKFEDQKFKVGVDHGLEWEKITLTLIPSSASPSSQTSTVTQQPDTKRQRRKRDDGVKRVGKNSSTGQETILFLGVVRAMKESANNFKTLWEKLKLEQLDYTITGDLSALMQLFGLMSCSSSHPCLYCPQRRSKGEWQGGHVELRSMGSLAAQYQGWVSDGSKYDTEHTSRYQSTVGSVIVRSCFDNDDTTVLEKAAPPAVHLLLAVNDILRPHCIQFFDSEEHLMIVLKTEVGVIPHNYQGKEGTFEGPQCNKILNKVGFCTFFIGFNVVNFS
jgi:hypothetical protein